MFKRFKPNSAVKFNERGNILREEGDWRGALELYERAAALDPRWSAPQYNLGLVFKSQKQWRKSIEHNQLAVALNPKDEAAWWNLGIAATAVGDWDLARSAWRGFGIEIPPGSGPIDFPAGMTPIRLNPEGDNVEIVWSERLCPARARIVSIPLPESNHRWRDIVLNDGAPLGYRKHQGQDVAVFNELMRLEESPYGTFLAEVAISDAFEVTDFEKLVQSAGQDHIGLEDWTSSIHVLCKACSEGRPHKTHDEEFAPPPPGVRRVAIAAKTLVEARTVVEAWPFESRHIQIESIRELVEPLS